MATYDVSSVSQFHHYHSTHIGSLHSVHDGGSTSNTRVTTRDDRLLAYKLGTLAMSLQQQNTPTLPAAL
jgi:hypothetical protein